ncbi:MAG: DUF547 domain-containing protein [Pseudomonadota bacterium]
MPVPSVSRRALLAVAAAAPIAAALPRTAAAGPASRLIDPMWTASGRGGDPDAGPWAEVLARRLRLDEDGVARFDYAGLRGELSALNAWLDAYAAADPRTLTRPAQYAYWANLYNALTVKLVAEAWPVDTIKTVNGGLFNTGPWKDDVASVAGQDLSLDDIEHGIMRPVFQDPRIHYAVNCASIGCPNLQPRPFSAAALEEMLEAGARAYVNDPRGARLDGDRLTVSSIYDWFQEDFGGTEAGVLDHLRRYAEPPLRSALEGRTGYDRDDYDWAVNAV